MKQLSFDKENDLGYMVKRSIELLQNYEKLALSRNPRGYIVGYSGGKDSEVLLDLFNKSGVRYHVIHNHTTIDTPTTVYYVRRKFHALENRNISCTIHKPNLSFWALCRKRRMLPSRIQRFCCSNLKEVQFAEYRYGVHSFGVRKAESVARAKNRDSVEVRNRLDYSDNQNFKFDNLENAKELGYCYTQKYVTVNPLAYWSNSLVWEYIESEKLELNPLYSQGFNRVGCIGCPLAGTKTQQKEFLLFPKYKKLYLDLCERIIQDRNGNGLKNKYGFKNGNEYFEWWLIGKGRDIDPDQMEF